jgi:hypothetical protein
METVRDLIKPHLKNDHIVSVKIVTPTDLDDQAILRVIVDFKDKNRQTITLKCFYPPDDTQS